mmetsp:Transcript_21582/g.54896  ORF Transcript_21582/g.54896 Transcript_21582/m.54896 type:complete len:202 (-) Transcript_21582:333-938(-)
MPSRLEASSPLRISCERNRVYFSARPALNSLGSRAAQVPSALTRARSSCRWVAPARTTMIAPPGRSTRQNSSQGEGEKQLKTTSKEPSAKGKRCGEPTAKRAAGCRLAAYRTASLLTSVPHSCAFSRCSSRRYAPSPQPALRTWRSPMSGQSANARETSAVTPASCAPKPPASKKARLARTTASLSACCSALAFVRLARWT